MKFNILRFGIIREVNVIAVYLKGKKKVYNPEDVRLVVTPTLFVPEDVYQRHDSLMVAPVLGYFAGDPRADGAMRHIPNKGILPMNECPEVIGDLEVIYTDCPIQDKFSQRGRNYYLVKDEDLIKKYVESVIDYVPALSSN